MAENALGTMNREKDYSRQFAVSACYYSMYYSLYTVLMRIGIKCEIHSCTLEFMKRILRDFYTGEDLEVIKKAFDCREIAQYYFDKVVAKEDEQLIMARAPLFLNKSKDVISRINNQDIEKMVAELRKSS